MLKYRCVDLPYSLCAPFRVLSQPQTCNEKMQQQLILYQTFYQIVARAFNTQNRCGPRAFIRDRAAIRHRLLLFFTPSNTGLLFGYSSN